MMPANHWPPEDEDQGAFQRYLHSRMGKSQEAWTPYAEMRKWRRRFYWLLAIGIVLAALLVREAAR